MATEQELAAANARIAELEKGENERAKAAGVARELSRYDLASPAALQQLTDLIAPTVQVSPLGGGRHLIHGADYKPLEAVIAERIRQPDHAHFLKANQATAPPAGATQAAAPAVPTANPLPPGRFIGSLLGQAGRGESLPGETLGQAMLRAAQGTPAAQGDPRLNPAMAFGLGRAASRK